MSRNLLTALTGAVCACALLVPAGAAQAADHNDRGRPEIGPCKSKVDKVKAKPNGKTAAQRKADKKRVNDHGFTTGVSIICK